MLARYLATRVRYAKMPPRDPQLEQALRNFLALNTRAHDLPHLAHQAQPALQQVGGGSDQELLQQLLHGVLGEHDPSALAMLLDVHSDLTGRRMLGPDDLIMPPEEGDSPEMHHQSLMDFLDMLHHVGQTGARGGDAFDMRGQYGNLGGVSTRLANHIAANIGPIGDARRSMLNLFHAAEGPGGNVVTHPLAYLIGRMCDERSDAAGGRVDSFPHLYDVLLRLQQAAGTQHPGVAQHATDARGLLSQGIREQVVPIVEGREPTVQPPF